jgi:transketolase
LEIDAHNFEEIINSLEKAKETKKTPVIILARSIPGKGVSFMENDYQWHGKAPNEKEFKQAIKELKIKEKNL